MKKLLLLVTITISLMFSSINMVGAAATLWGVNFEFTNEYDRDVGSLMLTFDPIDFNSVVQFTNLTPAPLEVSGAVFDVDTGYGFSNTMMSRFGDDSSIHVSNELPWFPVSFAGGYAHYFIEFQTYTDDYQWFSLTRMKLDGTWLGMSTDLLSSEGVWTASMWFDDPVPTPIPASALLLISGILPAVAFRKRFVRT